MRHSGYGKAFRAAFPYTIPVLTGYLFIGIAFGVMYQEKGYNFIWAALMPVSGSEFFCSWRELSFCDVYDLYGECAPYFLWPVPAGAVCKNG